MCDERNGVEVWTSERLILWVVLIPLDSGERS